MRSVSIQLYIGIAQGNFNLMRLFLSLPLFKKMLIMLMAMMMPMISANAASNPIKLLIFGDSLVAGYGLPQGVAFPDQLQQSFDQDSASIRVINGGISGDTMAGGASRIAWSLADRPDAVVVVLGGNDALRGLSPDNMQIQLDTIISAIQDQGLPLLVAGMYAPANMGAEYGARFEQAFQDAISDAQARIDHSGSGYLDFYPFFLDGVALEPLLNQSDGIHPNEDGVAEIVRRIKPSVQKLIAQLNR